MRAAIDLPSGYSGPLRLRFRLPPGKRLGAATVNGAAATSWVGAETLDLSGRSGHLDVVVRVF